MDESVEGGKTEEIKAREGAPAEVVEEKPVAESPPAAEAPARPKKSHDWKLIALIVVSGIAVLLLVATITLAATGDFSGGRGNAKLKRFEERQWGDGPMFRDRGGLPGGPPQWKDLEELNKRIQPDGESTPPSDTAPTPVPESGT